MSFWWETATLQETSPHCRAVAYYRHSAQDRQENSIPIQREQVCKWAEENGVDIIHEFSDAGRSGLNVEGRPAFNEMMDDWVQQRSDFKYILCLDVSRWGRFQDIDLSAQYSAICKKHDKEVIYTTIGKPKEDDPLYPVYVQFERFRAAQYSKELSDKVWRGCAKIAEQGYWAGGKPPYGLKRLLLDENREPTDTLAAGQRKGIQNQRVTLTVGDPAETKVVIRIFHEFVDLGYSEYRIAERLNEDKIPSPSGCRWAGGFVSSCLRNEKYAGTMVYNRTSQKLKTPSHSNPPDQWIRTPGAFESLVDPEMFQRAQEIIEERRRKYDPERMLEELENMRLRCGIIHASLLRINDEIPTSRTFSHRFGSMDGAIQELYSSQREKAKQDVHERIRQCVPGVLPYSDFLVLDQKLTLSVQPAVPVQRGYSSYWPDRKSVV